VFLKVFFPKLSKLNVPPYSNLLHSVYFEFSNQL
jgi:hypothetical protein